MTDRTGCDTPESMEARTIERAMKRIEALKAELAEAKRYAQTLRCVLADVRGAAKRGEGAEVCRELADAIDKALAGEIDS